jgi:CCR4-NOT complex subunit CAF16
VYSAGVAEPTIEIRDLRFSYPAAAAPVLDGVRFTARAGMRCLLIGANGAGKTTLLRVIAGKHMVPAGAVRVLGRPAFDDTSLATRVEMLGGPFPFEVDVRVGALVDGVRGVDPARRARLIALLGVDVDWHMHRVSDGQRRRVQILLGLLRPAEVLLLDEVTTDLDLLARQDLLAFLREESGRGATIVYATHIFDSLDEWATDLAYMVRGRVTHCAPLDQVAELRAIRAAGESNPLLRLVEGWLRRDTSGPGGAHS